jgi:hypothetical protein
MIQTVMIPWFGPAANYAAHYTIAMSAGTPAEQQLQDLDPKSRRPPTCGGLYYSLILLFASFFTATLTRKGFLQTRLLAWLQVVGMTLHFLNNVFLLNLPLKPA